MANEEDRVVDSNDFTITWQCPTAIEIFEPTDLVHYQTFVMSEDVSVVPYWTFKSFLTRTKACPGQMYQVTKIESTSPVLITERLIDKNLPEADWCETGALNGVLCSESASGTVYTNTFNI
jgi:hypothetical protein